MRNILLFGGEEIQPTFYSNGRQVHLFLNLTIQIQIDSPPSQENNTKKTAVNIYYNLSPNSVDPLILELASIIQEAN